MVHIVDVIILWYRDLRGLGFCVFTCVHMHLMILVTTVVMLNSYGMITTPHSTTQWLSNMLTLSYTVQSWVVGYREVLCTLLLYAMKFAVMISGTHQLGQDIE